MYYSFTCGKENVVLSNEYMSHQILMIIYLIEFSLMSIILINPSIMYLTNSSQKMYLTNLKRAKAGIGYMLHDRSFSSENVEQLFTSKY